MTHPHDGNQILHHSLALLPNNLASHSLVTTDTIPVDARATNNESITTTQILASAGGKPRFIHQLKKVTITPTTAVTHILTHLFIGLDSFEAINPTTAGTTTVTSPVKLANPVKNSGVMGDSTPAASAAKTLTTHINSAAIMKTNLFILLRF